MNNGFYYSFCVLLAVGLQGCAASKVAAPRADRAEIMRAYVAGVTRYDGISAQEAILLAQSEMIFRGQDQKYYLGQPVFERIDAWNWGVRFYPINKNAGAAKENPSILVVVNKKDGVLTWYPQGMSYIFLEPTSHSAGQSSR